MGDDQVVARVSTGSMGTTLLVANCVICEHSNTLHVPKCPDDAECGGTDLGYCLGCWEQGASAEFHDFALYPTSSTAETRP